MSGSQLVDYLGRVRGYGWPEDTYHWEHWGWLWGFQSPCLTQSHCLSALCWWIKYKLSATASAPSLPTCCHASARLVMTTWNCKQGSELNAFCFTSCLGDGVSSQRRERSLKCHLWFSERMSRQVAHQSRVRTYSHPITKPGKFLIVL